MRLLLLAANRRLNHHATKTSGLRPELHYNGSVSRLRRIEHSGRFFFVTTNVARSVPKLSAQDRNLCLEYLAKSRAMLGFALFACVIMPDHAHLLVACFRSSLPAVMNDWKRKSALAITKLRGTSGSIWQPRYFDFILRRASDFGKKLGYIHNNPVEAGFVAKPEDWEWSSAAYYVNNGPAPIQPDTFNVPADPNEPLWPAPWR